MRLSRRGASPIAWYATPALHADAVSGFPQSLSRVPVLLPTGHTAVRGRLDLWLAREGIRRDRTASLSGSVCYTIACAVADIGRRHRG